MKCIVFRVRGDYARFRKAYTTTSALTYLVMHPVAVKGMLGAILGIDKKDLYEETKTLDIGIQVLKDIRKDMQSFNLVNMKSSDTIFRFPSNVEFLRDVEYRIFVKGNEEKLNKVKKALSSGEFVFTPYLGASEHVAKIIYEGEYEINLLNQGDYEVDTLINKEKYKVDLIKEPMTIYTDNIPIKNNINREYVAYAKVLFSINTPLKIKNSFCYKVENKKVIFIDKYKSKSHPHQTLEKHLHEVRDIALKINKSHSIDYDIDKFIEIVCMCHDFGKATTYFQDYLDGKYNGREKQHGIISALFTYYILPDKYKHLGFLIVKKHHGNIDNGNDECKKDEVMWKFNKQIEDMKRNNIDKLNIIYKDYLGDRTIEDFFEWISDDDNLKSIKREFIQNKYTVEELFLCEYVYSLLLTADKSQLILKEAFIPSKPYPSDFIKSYKDNLVKDTLDKNPKLDDSLVFNMRNQIYDDIIENLNKIDLQKNKILSINVPTGTGKTILAYQTAFKLSEIIHNENENIRPNIIYALPFTSIIDQNYQVLSEIIKVNTGKEADKDDLLKYHSVTPIEYKDFKGYDARFCFENWQSKIICTTFVQLFNTIFKVGDNSIVNRFHRLANSIIILDEVQAIEEKYYLIIRSFIEILSEKYNCYVILVTATMPLLLDTVELVDKKENYFKKLNRINIINNTDKDTTLDEFKDIVLEDINNNENKSFLIVLNTVKSSKEVYDYLLRNTQRKMIYLSSEIYPKLRLEKIDKIKKSKEKYVVVSTQLIEAGVDIDLDIVYRDFATLDSINQTAGRANRNGIESKGVVNLYKIIDDQQRYYCNYIYPRYLLSATEEVLKDKFEIEESEIFNLNKEYFEKVSKRLSNDTSNKMLKYVWRLEFKKFRDEFELIDKKKTDLIKVDLIINIDNETNKIIKELINDDIEDSIELKNKFRFLRQYTISISKNDMFGENNINYKTIDKYNIYYIDKEDYNCESGVIRSKNLIF